MPIVGGFGLFGKSCPGIASHIKAFAILYRILTNHRAAVIEYRPPTIYVNCKLVPIKPLKRPSASMKLGKPGNYLEGYVNPCPEAFRPLRPQSDVSQGSASPPIKQDAETIGVCVRDGQRPPEVVARRLLFKHNKNSFMLAILALFIGKEPTNLALLATARHLFVRASSLPITARELTFSNHNCWFS